MSRAAYNDVCDIYRGPAPLIGTPNALYRANVRCRYVPYDKILPRMDLFTYETAWVTHPLPVVSQGGADTLLSPLVTFDFDQYDRIIFQSDLVRVYLAWASEECLVGTPQRYARARLIELPLSW